MKTVIYVWKNNSIHRSKQCDDLFKLIQTTCYLYYLSKKMSFILYVDTQHHSISKCLPPLIHPYTKIIETYPIPIIHDLDYYIQSTNKDLLYFSSTTYLHHTIMPDCSSFIRKILEPPQSMLKRLPTNITTVVHVQINEPIISKFKYPHLLYTVYYRIYPYLSPTTIVISDTYEFKTYLKSKCIVFDTRIGNIGFTPHDDAVEDTLFDLYIMTKATKIYTFSWLIEVMGVMMD